MKKAIVIAMLATGCGPTFEQICGTGLTGAVLSAIVAWLLLLGVRRVRDRIATGQWPSLDRTTGFPAMTAAFFAVSAAAWTLAPQVKADTVALVLMCAAGNLLAWALLVQLITGWTAAGAVLLAGLLSLGPAVGGAAGIEPLAIATIYQWFWGGVFGGLPAAIILLIWFAAWLKRRRAQGA